VNCIGGRGCGYRANDGVDIMIAFDGRLDFQSPAEGTKSRRTALALVGVCFDLERLQSTSRISFEKSIAEKACKVAMMHNGCKTCDWCANSIREWWHRAHSPINWAASELPDELGAISCS